ncbi:MAG TPA: hypothetical protein EYP28_04705 [Methanophagales archaeon]|nr:hypothetical protein [Methanophagales archaeon]
MPEIQIDHERCKGCDLCLNLCPKQVLDAGCRFFAARLRLYFWTVSRLPPNHTMTHESFFIQNKFCTRLCIPNQRKRILQA